jgi:ADP-heptose:LPS heptosyltransferase
MKIKKDCRYFRGDKPCYFHKKEGVRCNNCSNYEPVKQLIVIIKMGSAGDVLRTTSILPGLRSRYPQGFIFWVTKTKYRCLLKNNPYIDRVLHKELEILGTFKKIKFDLAVNLDVSHESAALFNLIDSSSKKGFSLDRRGVVTPVNRQAKDWYMMGVSDKKKKENKKSYAEIVLEISGLDKDSLNKPMFFIPKTAANWAKHFRQQNDITSSLPLIGISINAGNRWQLKSPSAEKYLEIISVLHNNLKAQLILLAGPEEKEKYNQIVSKADLPLFTPGVHNMGKFAALIEICDLIITPDSLSLHLALALSKKIVVFFGPTSAAEIDFFDKGKKVLPSLECLCCYRESCDKKPNCMEMLNSLDILKAAECLLFGS